MNRPVISTYSDPVAFMADMLAFRKSHEKHFSVLRVTKSLRRISPTLVTLLLQRKRKITTDRVEELSKLLGLSPHERQFFRDWIARANGEMNCVSALPPSLPPSQRKSSTAHLLSDWINVYVKDAFQLERVQQNPNEVYSLLSGIASQKRIDKSVEFLLRAGYLRRDLSGRIVEDTPLHVVDQRIPNEKVRQFHKGVLKNAINAIDLYSPTHRYANALIVPLNEARYRELTQIIEEFAEKLQIFAEGAKNGNTLYQVLINLSPTGGLHEK